jgi:hypothetical protein
MTATAADYTWFSERFPALAEAYCLTLVDKLTPVEVLDRVGARERTQLTATSQLVTPAYVSRGVQAHAEHLTGVRLTPTLLESAEYLGGVAQLPAG